mmetsp:Transcript_25783/g.54029  ORF Transcript_25783/g.54029 Transcript_25783/m.54029 type:complete len:254 (-) Transcript_25783:1203-1964(-)
MNLPIAAPKDSYTSATAPSRLSRVGGFKRREKARPQSSRLRKPRALTDAKKGRTRPPESRAHPAHVGRALQHQLPDGVQRSVKVRDRAVFSDAPALLAFRRARRTRRLERDGGLGRRRRELGRVAAAVRVEAAAAEWYRQPKKVEHADERDSAHDHRRDHHEDDRPRRESFVHVLRSVCVQFSCWEGQSAGRRCDDVGTTGFARMHRDGPADEAEDGAAAGEALLVETLPLVCDFNGTHGDSVRLEDVTNVAQ